MSSAFAMAETERHISTPARNRSSARPLRIEELSNNQENEVLAFLAQRSVHTVYQSSLIRDNGLISLNNRGTFYGCRNQDEQLEGVALFGQKTLVDASSPRALDALGRFVTGNPAAHLVRSQQHELESLLGYYAAAGRQPRLVRREILLEQFAPAPGLEPEARLRRACSADLPIVVSINACLVLEECGIDPMSKDPQGMLDRTERRINQGRVWMLRQNGQTIFKADVISETPEVVFVEGVFVRREERRKGHGLRCMTQLARNLLSQSKSICLVVNEENSRARAFYEKAGFKFSSNYNTAYFTPL